MQHRYSNQRENIYICVYMYRGLYRQVDRLARARRGEEEKTRMMSTPQRKIDQSCEEVRK